DIKTLAYVIMPNYFSWMFKLSETQDDPVSIYGDVKRQVAIEIMNSLREECKQEQPYQLVDLFRGNERVSRTSPQRLLWTFQEQAKEFEGNKHFKIWTPKTRLQRLDSPEMITKSLECIKKAPMSERWQMVADAEEYPYLYVSEELADKDGDSVASFVSSIIQPQRAALPA
ncbi:MAG: hypothetical protein ABH859_08765, partial [Pseudomonadota bacterium]